MWQLVIFTAGASLPLAAGGVLGSFWQPPGRLTAVALAFSAGALISAVAFELFMDSYQSGGALRSGLGFAAGAVVFVVLDSLLDKKATGRSAVGLALLAAVTLDGIPENVALGISLAEGGSLALLLAIFASNFPEALTGAAKLRDDGRSHTFVISLWVGATGLLAAAVIVGHLAFAGTSPEDLAVPLAFAGGAVLASVIDTIAPEAFKDGGPYVALASAAGFFCAFLLSH